MSSLSDPVQDTLKLLNLLAIPPHPSQQVLQRGGDIKQGAGRQAFIHIFFKILLPSSFTETEASQKEATEILGNQGLDIGNLEDLGSRWSIRWSKDNNKNKKDRCCVVQCHCGTDSKQGKLKMIDKNLSKAKASTLKHESAKCRTIILGVSHTLTSRLPVQVSEFSELLVFWSMIQPVKNRRCSVTCQFLFIGMFGSLQLSSSIMEPYLLQSRTATMNGT
ncbi:hypothetical protein M422DRAFT_45464 [Sphaerobolus stellatus SS14]|nr:hypothetical protein M422DRAFT_45464 [Sphaerobolus stellatus SS14]